MIVYILTLFVVLSIITLSSQSPNKNKGLVWLFYILFIGVTLLRSDELPDYKGYYDYFLTGKFERAEFGFKFYINTLKYIITSPELLFLSVALLSVGIKWSAIRKLSTYIWGSLLIYLSYFLILHDMIQIRVAVASGLLLWSTKYLYERNAIKFIVTTIIAILFHTSAIVILPLWFINTKTPQKKIYLWMVPIAYIITIMGYAIGYLIAKVPIAQIQELWLMYEYRMANNEGVDINIFNSLHLMRCFMCTLILFNIDKIAKYCPFAIIWSKIYTISLVAFLLLSDIPVAAFRISELFQIIEILLIPTILLIPRYRQLGKYLIIVFAGFCLFINIFYNQFIV